LLSRSVQGIDTQAEAVPRPGLIKMARHFACPTNPVDEIGVAAITSAHGLLHQSLKRVKSSASVNPGFRGGGITHEPIRLSQAENRVPTAGFRFVGRLVEPQRGVRIMLQQRPLSSESQKYRRAA